LPYSKSFTIKESTRVGHRFVEEQPEHVIAEIVVIANVARTAEHRIRPQAMLTVMEHTDDGAQQVQAKRGDITEKRSGTLSRNISRHFCKEEL
jgi:hypothetical protein